MTTELIIAILGGSAVAALINQCGEYIRARKKHQESTEDNENAEIVKLKEEVSNLKEGVRMILLDRIKLLGQQHIKNKEIDFEDRRLIHQMHSVYHDKMDGNGDLDSLMNEVNDLPLKTY